MNVEFTKISNCIIWETFQAIIHKANLATLATEKYKKIICDVYRDACHKTKSYKHLDVLDF